MPMPGLPHDDRHPLYRTLASEALVREHHHMACNDEDHQAGPMKAGKDFRPKKILASLRQEQGRKNSCIPKNERMRQRPFDEALRAEFEWMSQNRRTYFSQPCCCCVDPWRNACRVPADSASSRLVLGWQRVFKNGWLRDMYTLTYVSQCTQTGGWHCWSKGGL